MSDISFGPRFPASAASDGGNIDLTGDHSREPDYDYVQRGTVESLRARIAALEAENARLRAALEGAASQGTAEDGFCWCDQRRPDGRHWEFCEDARAALAASAGEVSGE